MCIILGTLPQFEHPVSLQQYSGVRKEAKGRIPGTYIYFNMVADYCLCIRSSHADNGHRSAVRSQHNPVCRIERKGRGIFF